MSSSAPSHTPTPRRSKSPKRRGRSATKPEVLAPVGGWPQLQAAIENGADAVYFGLSHFNARARANNFTLEELPRVMHTLHERGVLGFVTFNTLVYDSELEHAHRVLEAVVESGVDAVIVQDLGVVRMIRAISPDLPIHGSTQMTITSAEGASVIEEMGVERVVLARELSVKEISTISIGTSMELEVFVHGALCVSYSGQCFSSEAWGGRSANRGQCAQACRLPYDLIVDGEIHPTGDAQYLLSPQDLMGVDQISDLIEAGVSCFKIEGRLKGPEYVAMTTRTYREAVDKAWERRNVDISRDQRRALELVFSRGHTPGFLEGVQHQRLVRGRSPRHRGVLLGEVLSVTRRGVRVRLQNPVKRGDGVVFDAADPQNREEGGKVYEIFHKKRSLEGDVPEGRTVELRFGPGVRLSSIEPGHLIWKNRDEALEAELQTSWTQGIQRRDPVDALVTGELDQPLTLILRDTQGNEGRAHTEQTLQTASKRDLNATTLTKSLSRLGATPFLLNTLSLDLPEGLFLPVSALNQLRRDACEALLQARTTSVSWTLSTPASQPLPSSLLPTPLSNLLHTQHAPPSLSVLARTPEQIDALLELPWLDEIIVDFLELKGLKQAIPRIQAAKKRAIVASPRILKPKEERIWRFLLNLKSDAILVRGLGLLRTLRDITDEPVPPLYGDFSLNTTNALTAKFLLSLGLERLTPGHDLNADQLCALAETVPSDQFELIVHHYMPIFHTEHCVFCRFMSDGTSWRDCGRPCEEHTVSLRDRTGHDHPVLADMGCRNTVFNAQAQSGAMHMERFLSHGVRRFRVELLQQNARETQDLVHRYEQALSGASSAPSLWRWLSQTQDRGVTLGSFVVSDEPRVMKPTAR